MSIAGGGGEGAREETRACLPPEASSKTFIQNHPLVTNCRKTRSSLHGLPFAWYRFGFT